MGNINQNLSWTIRNLQPSTTYYWSVQAVDNSFAGGAWAPEKTFTTGPTGIGDEPAEKPTQFSLAQNHPNPFNPSTTIKFQIPHTALVTLKIYDLTGKEVIVLMNEQKPAGSYKVEFDADKLASGMYFYQLEAGEFREIRKMLLVR